ncbi:hypothetical protein [Streptomyces sp. Isolate_219]|uniref:hypothetical protein n=1 Tax=Streptomyces sp. Isolate_219 TaxID=2950110 RepID=UPI0021CA6BE9|nr:hypothetical protein [Streptomyces sp. Isolate_219]MCR8576504.1 hypothetical protein [Streptomyces sp. Isolate_219]
MTSTTHGEHPARAAADGNRPATTGTGNRPPPPAPATARTRPATTTTSPAARRRSRLGTAAWLLPLSVVTVLVTAQAPAAYVPPGLQTPQASASASPAGVMSRFPYI